MRHEQQPIPFPSTVRNQLHQVAEPIQTKGALVICGFPASGKSSAARFLAARMGAVVLDKDQLAPVLEESVMGRLTGDPFDRDSDIYREVVAPGIYDSLIRTGLTVAARHPVVLDAPFLSTMRAAGAAGLPLGVFMRQHAEADTELPVVTVWIDTPTEQIRQRMITRGSARDAPKLADWPAYRSSVLDSGARELGRTVCDLVIDN
ncbi:ATP-binding protein [Nocardia puris]|uniref:AAA family ATPase n=1 Tax=Nocardia puris TaxID=208602 RepID=UPI001895AA1F|nr:ATP-binding protein [Nocardia puris]MBF6216072.1 ATP-binding protein [Nocardia puris]